MELGGGDTLFIVISFLNNNRQDSRSAVRTEEQGNRSCLQEFSWQHIRDPASPQLRRGRARTVCNCIEYGWNCNKNTTALCVLMSECMCVRALVLMSVFMSVSANAYVFYECECL